MVDEKSGSSKKRRSIGASPSVDRKRINELLMGSLKGCCLSESELKERILEEVENAIDEYLPMLKNGQGLGILFNLYVTDHTGRVEGSPRDLRDDELSKEWRNAVLVRDRYACQGCGSNEDLQAHHVKDWANNPELRLDVNNGKTLCVLCHAQQHPEIKGLILSNANRKRKRKTVETDTGS